MANPICLSPLKFYDGIAKQRHRKTYAYGQISPLVVKQHTLPPFQFVIPNELFNAGSQLSTVILYDAKTDKPALPNNLAQILIETGFTIKEKNGYKIAVYPAKLPIHTIEQEGFYYLKLASSNNEAWKYYSEVFCFASNTDSYIEIEYWNETGDFSLKNGAVTFDDCFHFKLLLNSELRKPEYNFEEESTKRLGYTFVESQVSKKTYKFNTIVPEFICDAMRIIRLCDNKIIRNRGDEYEAITFEMDAEWQTQGDSASVNCEFETDNVIVNLGGFTPEDQSLGSFNNDYSDDYDIN
jgi:hypothetical protein